MKITLNKILFVIWFILLYDSSVNHTSITVIFLIISFINWWIRDTIEHRIAMRKQGGADPWEVYAQYMQNYYFYSGMAGGWSMGWIRLPTPFDPYYYKRKKIWTKDGFWQQEWNNYCLGRASVYTGFKTLPRPWHGPTDGELNPSITFVATDAEVTYWRNMLINNTLSLEIRK